MILCTIQDDTVAMYCDAMLYDDSDAIHWTEIDNTLHHDE